MTFDTNLSEQEWVVLIAVISVIIIVFIIIAIHMQRGSEFYKSLNMPTFAPPPWIFFIITGALLLSFGVGGWAILTQANKYDIPICLTLWIASGVLLWSAYLAFFERNLITETMYLLMAFLAFHVAILYKLQFVSKVASSIYFGAAILVIYIILVTVELSRLN